MLNKSHWGRTNLLPKYGGDDENRSLSRYVTFACGIAFKDALINQGVSVK